MTSSTVHSAYLFRIFLNDYEQILFFRCNLLTHVRVSHKDLLNKDGNVQAEPKAKTPKKSPKSSKIPIECPNCQNLFENEEKLMDHVETCNEPPETEEGAEKVPPSLLTCIWRLGTIHILINHLKDRVGFIKDNFLAYVLHKFHKGGGGLKITFFCKVWTF